jgi:hypothetical protein
VQDKCRREAPVLSGGEHAVACHFPVRPGVRLAA